MLYKYTKRLFDVIISIVAFLILLPIFLICSILLFIINGNPFFTQIRPGKDAELFRIIKFKTMRDERDIYGELLPDNKRLTVIGKLIRRMSIDEIPQLINVIMGNMSLIGPRPLLCEYLPLYNKHQNRRHEVRPGITGWAQVNGRNRLNWNEKFDLDVWYVDNISFFLDLKILFLTFATVVKSKGITSGTSMTMEKFEGNK